MLGFTCPWAVPPSWAVLTCSCAQRWCGEMEGAGVLSASPSMVGQASGSCSSWLCPHMCLTQAWSSPALMSWECVCVSLCSGSTRGADGGSVTCGTGGDASPSSAHLQAEVSVARLVHGALEESDSLLWSWW